MLRLGVDFRSLAVPGLPWPTLAVPGLPWPTLAYPGLPWPTQVVLTTPPLHQGSRLWAPPALILIEGFEPLASPKLQGSHGPGPGATEYEPSCL